MFESNSYKMFNSLKKTNALETVVTQHSIRK